MTKRKRIFRRINLAVLIILGLIIILGGSYTAWNASGPDKTCNSCHEINPSYDTWTASAHRDVKCHWCHGTAMSNGWHSLTEKSNMLFSHFGKNPRSDDIRLSEAQIIETLDRCKNCHQTEYASWKSSGHSASYSDIFLNEIHNTTERLNFDCLRCHGMFYEGTTNDLIEPISMEGPWHLMDETISDQPTIPCMACHTIHSVGYPAIEPDHSDPGNIFYGRKIENNSIGFYSRHEKFHFSLDHLPTPVMMLKGDTVKAPQDEVYRLCVQCHAPSVWHQAGQGDDRTPTGVHEGLSCRACHERHTNNQRNLCSSCHPAISNCGIDVKLMNTTYLSPDSPHDIHSVACVDCHENI